MGAERPLDAPVLLSGEEGSARATIRERLIPVASMQVDDARFEFDSSFVLPEARDEFTLVDSLRRDHPGAPISVFGHADPVGADEYNKVLSGRRALAIFGILTRRVDIWERLHAKPHGRDKWEGPAFATMRQALAIADGSLGVPKSAGERATLFAAYMDFLCRDLAEKVYRLDPARDFLARGADKEGKGDVQGCGEFNPDIVLAKGTPGRNDAGPNPERDAANAPNRRVVVLLFAAGSAANPADWPCPRAVEGTAGCIKRLWSDAARRRAAAVTTREQVKTADTYACRFYDRLAPPPSPRGAARMLSSVLRITDPEEKPRPGVRCDLTVSGITITLTSDADGKVLLRYPSTAPTGILEMEGNRVEITFDAIARADTPIGAQQRLVHLGLLEGPVDGVVGPRTISAIRRFQSDAVERGETLAINGTLDAPTAAALVRAHGS